jgi:hypothetical protein
LPLESRTPGFACTYRERNPVVQIRGEMGPDYWASTSNPSVAKGFIQTLADNVSTVCWGAVMLEPHLTTDFQRQYPADRVRFLGEMLGEYHQ